MPLALVCADHEDVAKSARELRGADDVVGGADKAALRRRRGMPAMDADIAARNPEEALASRNVVAWRVRMLRVVLRVVERKAPVLRNRASRRAHSARVFRGIVAHLLRLGEIVDRRAALCPTRHGDYIPTGEPSHRLVHRHVPARYPRAEVHRREVAPFVRLRLLVAVFVRPRLETLSRLVELGAELPFARSDALVYLYLRCVGHPPSRDCAVELALWSAPEARASPARRARYVAYALSARRLAVEKPFAALPDHDVRIGRAYRAAERTVDRRPEELRGKCAARGIPLRDAARERVGFRDPEEAL